MAETFRCAVCTFEAESFGRLLAHVRETGHGWEDSPKKAADLLAAQLTARATSK